MMRGHCECGQVTFEIDGDIKDFSHCHCSQCRRLHGAAFATFAGVEDSGFRYTSGEDSLSAYASSETNRRVFCAKCGSNILADPDDEPGMIYISMSCIEGNPNKPEAYHAWVGSKAPWYDILDDAEQYAEYADE